MKKLSKKWMMIVSILVVVMITVCAILFINHNDKTEETNYTAYVDINPLIKLNFKVHLEVLTALQYIFKGHIHD